MTSFIKTGMREIGKRKKLIWLWYAFNVLSAVIIVAPLAIAIFAVLGTSIESQRLFQNFDISWVTEFGWSAQWEQITMWLPLFAMAGGVFVLLTTWLSSGLLAVLHDASESFSGGCGRWFGPFLRLFLFALIFYGIAFGIRGGFAALFRKLGEDSMSGKPAAYSSMANFVITWLVFSLVNMILDYAKVHMVTHNERQARRGLAKGIRFVFAHFRRTVTIYLVLTGYMLLMMAVYHVWSEVIGQSSVGAVLFLLLARQLYMFGRTWLRMVWLASENAYFASLIPKPEPAPPPVMPTAPQFLENLEFNESF